MLPTQPVGAARFEPAVAFLPRGVIALNAPRALSEGVATRTCPQCGCRRGRARAIHLESRRARVRRAALRMTICDRCAKAHRHSRVLRQVSAFVAVGAPVFAALFELGHFAGFASLARTVALAAVMGVAFAVTVSMRVRRHRLELIGVDGKTLWLRGREEWKHVLRAEQPALLQGPHRGAAHG